MNKVKEQAILEVQDALISKGVSQRSAEDLLKKYSKSLNEWLYEYLVTGSRWFPEDFAKLILQSEQSVSSTGN